MRALRRLALHNVGHVLEVPAAGRQVSVAPIGGERHCTNLCAMRHAASIDELLKACAEEADADVQLCADCRDDLLRSVLRQRLSSN